MHGCQAANTDLLAILKEGMANRAEVQCIVFPPYVYLSQVAQILKGSMIAYGGQDVSANEPGAHTGEVAAQMLLDIGCRYTLVGHSERRAQHHENNTLVALKFAQAKQKGLQPILCVGETLEQHQAAQTEMVINAQIEAILSLEAGVSGLREAVIAYEPVWAIGTGLSATPQQAQAVHSMIRKKIAEHDNDIAANLSILYGGSVKASNAQALFTMADVDGGLVGGASLDGEEFLRIIECIN